METKKSPNVDLNGKSPLFLVIGLIVSLSITLTAFEWKKYETGDLMDLGELSDEFEEIIEIPPTEQPPQEAPKIKQPQVIEVPDDEEIIEEVDFDLDVDITEETEIEDVFFEAEPQEEEADDFFTIVEEEASFPGGNKAWAKFLNKNLKYPKMAKRMGIEGRVYLSFIVDTDGTISDIEVLRGIGGGCNEEAIRVLKASPNWNPGRQRGNAVKSRFQFFITFKLK